MKSSSLAVILLLSMAACTGEQGVPGGNGTSYLLRTTVEAPGAHCATGGAKVEAGADDNGNQVLDTAEVDSTVYVCTGADGQGVATAAEGPGANCAEGGVKVTPAGGAPTYVCGGATGATGAAGESVTVTPEPAGANCGLGGVKLQVGTGPASYLCNGAPAGAALPTVVTVDVTGVRYTEAVVDAIVTDDGGELIFARGVALATHAAPTIHDTVQFSGAGSGPFATRCGALASGTAYFVRAFATNALGTSYGEERTFTTPALTVPTLGTQVVSNITATTALSGGEITDDGGTPILGRGICWGLAVDPVTAGSCASEGVGAGSYLALMSGLASNTTHHVRAYATNAQGTAYGQDRAFTTGLLPLATVTTAATTAVAYTTATGGGTVVSDSGAPVTSRGVCWATTTAPTTAGTCTSEAGGLGTFTASLTGLTAGTTWYLRAYAVNGGGTSYGNQVSFTTLAPSAPVLSTRAVGGISSYLAGSGGVITTDGGSPITAKGVCWSLNPGPTIANSKTSDGTGPAAFNSTLTGLNPLTAYYVRAYATNALGTAYGAQVGFTTTDLVTPGPTPPVVGTSPSTITGSSTASSGGYVSNDGGSPVTSRGVCWSTAQNPTLSDSCSTDGGGVGYFSSTVTGLGGCGVVYYVRAYATNATGTAYGTQNTVSTGLLPTVATAPVSAIGFYDATSGGTVTDNGGCTITQKGVVWSWNPDPTVGNPKTTDGTGGAAFASSIAPLYANRTYYVRSYATNSVGTAYGQQEVFATLEPSVPYLGQSYAGGIIFYLDGSGVHGLVVTVVDVGYAPWGCEGVSIPTSAAFGSGAANTAAIIASCAEASFAAKMADNLVLNGYSDWFLPSLGELSLVWSNLQLKGLGGLDYSMPWSSTEADARQGYVIYFYNGEGWRMEKRYDRSIRAIRAF